MFIYLFIYFQFLKLNVFIPKEKNFFRFFLTREVENCPIPRSQCQVLSNGFACFAYHREFFLYSSSEGRILGRADLSTFPEFAV